jgi:ATP-dependent helicase HrpB
MSLPIFAILPELRESLRKNTNAVLIAPPGAGKTTMVAPALLEEAWCTGQVLLLSPRRLAARSAAERMAELAGERVGHRIGYLTRMDSKVSANTRILVITQGVFRNRIQADPELSGVSAVLFDEVHERALEGDFGLALALDAQAGLRPDLRLLAMSATLDGSRFAQLMGNAALIQSEGRSYPLTLRHIGRGELARGGGRRIEDDAAAAIRRALTDEVEGDVLTFLPGVGEINRTIERLHGIAAEIFPLHGALDPVDQRRALAPSHRRKVILATSIAETSLTIDGVRIVIDSGLARRARYDRTAGVTRLVTERVSQAAATQRAGRAARQGPGVAYRLWEEPATAGLLPFDPPEIAEADLTGLVLDCAIWGVDDPALLNWIDPPPAASVSAGRARLLQLDAVDADRRPTPHGQAIAQLPLAPALAHMVLIGARAGFAEDASALAILLTERGLGGTGPDLVERLRRWKREKGQRAEAARRLAARLAVQAASLSRQHAATAPILHGLTKEAVTASLVAVAFPDRLAQRRDLSGEQWQSVGGRAFRLDASDPLARSTWLAIADVQGSAAGARIISAAALDVQDVERLFARDIRSGAQVRFDLGSRAVVSEQGRWLGAIRLSKGQNENVTPRDIAAALLEGVREHGLALLPFGGASLRLMTRARFAGLVALEEAGLMDQADDWLTPLLTGIRRLDAISEGGLHDALLGLLSWEARQQLDAMAPDHFASPAGTSHAIDYGAPAGPTVELRVQALFGLSTHPVVGQARIPLVLSLTSPAGRPIQTTRDLPGFWKGSWADVAKEMRGRYPRHNWPDDPSVASASLKTKRVQGLHS